MCTSLKIEIKRYCVIDCKNWNGKLVHTVSSLNVEYMLCQAITEKDNETHTKLKDDKDTVTIVI